MNINERKRTSASPRASLTADSHFVHSWMDFVVKFVAADVSSIILKTCYMVKSLYSITFVNKLFAKWYKSCVEYDNYDQQLANWPFGQLNFLPFWPLVSATENVSWANLSVNTNLTGQLRSRNRPLAMIGPCQTCNKVAQFCRATLFSNEIARLTWQVAQLLMHHRINLPNRNHLYSLAIYCRISELWLARLHVILALLIIWLVSIVDSIMTLVLILVLKVTEKTFVVQCIHLIASCSNHLADGAVITSEHTVWGCSRWQAIFSCRLGEFMPRNSRVKLPRRCCL